MAQFDVYPNPRRSGDKLPFLLDLQTDVIALSTRVVAPLVDEKYFGAKLTRLHPVFQLQGRSLVLSTADLAGFPTRELRAPVANLAEHRAEILAAVDLLLTGI
jgi:toxin CcdB